MRTLLFLLGVSLAQAQPEAQPSRSVYEGRTITFIGFTPSEQPLPDPELKRILPMREGEVLRMAQVREAIQKLYETGRFSDISVDATSDGAGVRLIFATELQHFISRVSILGEKEPPNRNQLVTAARLDLGTAYRPSDVDSAKDRIAAIMRANGLFNSTVQAHVDLVDSTEEAGIFFDLQAGKRARFGGIEFITSDGQPLTEANKKSLTRASEWHRGIAFITLPGWRLMTENRLQTGIQQMQRELQQDDRLQARVTIERLAYDPATNKLTPVLRINRGPVVEVRTQGEKIKKSRLQQLLPIYQERAVDRALLIEGQRSLTEYMQSKGYFDAMVEYTQSEVENGRTVIEYQIEKGEKHKLRAIRIYGNEYFDYETLRERMFIQPASLIRFRNGRYSPRMLEQDLERVLRLYQSNGFLEAKVTAKVVEGTLKHSDISVEIRVEEGRQWFVRSLTIEGITGEDEDYLRTKIRSIEGQPFSDANIRADRDEILTYFFNDGYPDALFTWERSGLEDTNVDAKFSILPGKRQYVRGVLVRGLETTNPSLVASRIQLKEGDPLSQRLIAASQQGLYDLGIFAKVETAIQNPDGAEESKYVQFYADEARRYSMNLGVGAEFARIGGTAAGTAAFAPRVSFGISRINFLGVGHTVSLQTLVSTLQRRALLNYLAPQFNGNPDLSLTFSALFNHTRDVKTFSARRWEGSVQLSKRLSKSDTGQFRLTFRRVTLSDVKITQQLVPLLAQPVRVAIAGGTFFRDRRDDPVDSRRGVYNSIDVGYAYATRDEPTALSTFDTHTSFLRMVGRNSTYHPLKREVVLARTLQMGYIGRITGVNEIPLAERLFAGGASSHRGFPDNQAGPRDIGDSLLNNSLLPDPGTGFPIGGRALLFHSTELRFPLIGDNLGGVVFHDMGNVFSSLQSVTFRVVQRDRNAARPKDFDYMVHAVGAGIRYKTPVGPLRVDLAYGPNTPSFFGFNGSRDELESARPDIPLCLQGSFCDKVRISRFQFHFSLGQTF